MTYTTAAEDAKAIRQELKKDHGWTTRQVSVRSENFSMGSSINVRVKDPAVDLTVVEEVAKRIAESISRCEITHEILSGGNRYVSVNYSSDALTALAADYIEAIEALEQSDRYSYPIGDCNVRKVDEHGIFAVSVGGHIINAYSSRDAGVIVARNTQSAAS